jgi:hypothetical protein
VGVSSTPLENASLQEASYLKERRGNIVVKLLAESLVLVVLMALGWWGMMTLGSYSLQQMRYPIYVAGCPLADRLEKGSGGGSCSKEGVSHPITTRQPGSGLVEHAHGGERHREGKAPPRTSQNSYYEYFIDGTSANRVSPKFALTEFSQVRLSGSLGNPDIRS